jgi:hypothetical protein
MKKTILVSALIGLLAASANAGTVDGWDTTNVITPEGPYTDFTTYSSIIYKEDGSTNGQVNWKHGDVQAPGLKVVNNDDVNGSNCIMTTGYNPYDLSDKQCSDPLQSSKRTKVTSTISGPLEIDFVVSPDRTKNVYRIEQKLTNATAGDLWSGFTIELGTRGDDGSFVPSQDDDGLGFSNRKGQMFVSTTTDMQSDLVFSANFAQGLAGPADQYHPEPGYFNPVERMTFSMASNENTITATGISETYYNVFGNWVNSGSAPIAIFWDDDGDINTDNHLMGNCADSADLVHVGIHTGDDISGLSCDGTWVNWRGTLPGGAPEMLGDLSLFGQTVYASITEAKAAVEAGVETQPMYMDYVEDAANLGLNIWFTVDKTFKSDNLVIRYTPVVAPE